MKTQSPFTGNARFDKHIKLDPQTGCWEWIGARKKDGYGRASVKGRHVYAHRRSWELMRGPIPAGLMICHHCDNPPCVNPSHLFLGTHLDNMRDAAVKGRLVYPNELGQRGVGCGESHPRHRLTQSQVDQILSSIKGIRGEQLALAKRYGVSPKTINHICRGRRWNQGSHPAPTQSEARCN